MALNINIPPCEIPKLKLPECFAALQKYIDKDKLINVSIVSERIMGCDTMLLLFDLNICKFGDIKDVLEIVNGYGIEYKISFVATSKNVSIYKDYHL